MAYLKPPLFVQMVFNRLVMMFGWFDSATLVVPRQGGAEPQRIPVIPVEVQGSRYLVSTRGESMWVRNLRNSGQCDLQQRGTTRTFKASEDPVGERGPVLEAYRRKAGAQSTVTSNLYPMRPTIPYFVSNKCHPRLSNQPVLNGRGQYLGVASGLVPAVQLDGS